jgi:hypothetical protein
MAVSDCKVMQELTDPELALCRKDKVKAVELKGHGNACFSRREFGKALRFYSQVCAYSFGTCGFNVHIGWSKLRNGCKAD